MKKMLMLASVASMIDQFNMSNIQLLQEMGCEVHVACNFEKGNTCTKQRISDLKKRLVNINVRFFQIDFSRNILNISEILKAYKQVRELVCNENYKFIHCHSPIGGAIGRLVGHNTHTKVIYTAHGFHFYEGAPLLNWLLYYPIEKVLSRFTDVLITINREDYQRAKSKFYSKEIRYIPGVGVDVEHFSKCDIDKMKKRSEIGVPEHGFLLLSVGELQNRKNHRVVIEALHNLNNKNIFYIIVGKGKLKKLYENLIRKYNLSNNIKLLGFRTDINELCLISDCFVHPSIREGLGIAPLEAMAAGLPLISSYKNGIKDYTEDGVTGYCLKKPSSVNEMMKAIYKMYEEPYFRNKCGVNNRKIVRNFDQENTNKIMKEIYESIL